MTLSSHWYEADTRFIPGHYQPATLIDLALSRGIDSHRLLRGTGLFYDDIVAGGTLLSAQQFLEENIGNFVSMCLVGKQRDQQAVDQLFQIGRAHV